MTTRHAAVLLADGFEEIEAVSVIDILRRAGVVVLTLSIGDNPLVRGAHDISVKVDARMADAGGRTFDAVVLPGGMPGSANLGESATVRELLRRTHASGGIVAAVCATPLVLHAAGLLAGKRVTSFPGVAAKLTGATYTGKRTEQDGRIVTGQAAGSAIEFALAVVAALGMPEKGEALRGALLLTPDEVRPHPP